MLLIEANVDMNVISNQGTNEFHYLATDIDNKEAIVIEEISLRKD